MNSYYNNNSNLNKMINNNIITNGNNGYENLKLNFSPSSSSSSSPSSSPILPNFKNSNLLSLSKESPILLIIHSAQSPLSNSATPNSNLSPCLQSSLQTNQIGFQQLQLLNDDQKIINNSPQKNNTISFSSPISNDLSQLVPSLNNSSNNLNQYFQNSNIPIPKKNPSELITSRSLLCKTPDCIVCENGPPPSLDRGQVPIWAQILHVALFALTESSKISQAKLQSNGDKTNFPNGKRYFHLRDDIYEFINVHWDIICKRERIQNWKHTIGMTLSHYQNLFQNGYPIFQNTGYWCLKDDAPNPYTTDFMDSSRKRKYSKKNQQQQQQQQQNISNTNNSNNKNSVITSSNINNTTYNTNGYNTINNTNNTNNNSIHLNANNNILNNTMNINNNVNNSSFSKINSTCNNSVFNNSKKSISQFGKGSASILNEYDDDDNSYNWPNKRINSSNTTFSPICNKNVNNINNEINNNNNNKISINGLLTTDSDLYNIYSEKYNTISKDLFECKKELKELQGEISIIQNGKFKN
ncbi:hypothetical protein DICPUDRAFT_156391 [Dictyostelium purpureum]|uniref:Uncharacterized protein n=1 Tax=Dictyostelium purpureum TaxID=5786 RepID=F0ZWG2_DICPU|nr:uncharacterized protein DICPUDRAFT_156391 [Dictyostelium purpureum]EGC31725.1 hypothetical protein DICPUDRAFT_156391 [Dictyostelium purpureum]|eukprot:XP_003291759.1 hypothetical protein DICPUDRAFT_156391 [Dictyostelium purpureum]